MPSQIYRRVIALALLVLLDVCLNFAGAQQVALLKGHKGPALALAFSPDGKLLVSAGQDGTLRIWNVVQKTEKKVLTGHKGKLNAVAFAPDGKRLATAGEDRTVRLWDV